MNICTEQYDYKVLMNKLEKIKECGEKK